MNSAIGLAMVIAAGATACGLEDLGVRSVDFPLTATPITEPPAGISAETLAVLPGASGMVMADVLEDDLDVMVEGLPDLPTGFSYVAMGMFAEDTRAEIPCGEEMGGGHHHGAARYVGLPAGEELATVGLGALELDAETETWMVELSSADLSGVEMGALRGAMIMLMPDGGMGVMVLAGQVDSSECSSGGGGHTHGA